MKKKHLALIVSIVLVILGVLGIVPIGNTDTSPTQPSLEITLPQSDPTLAPTLEPTQQATQEPTQEPTQETTGPVLDEFGSYTTKEDVALYIHLYGRLPQNFITKTDARKLGWNGGAVEPYAPGKCIGGDRFGNYEGQLPSKPGRTWTECDIDTLGGGGRGAKRIVFSNDGLIYYTSNHYESFVLLYGDPDK